MLNPEKPREIAARVLQQRHASQVFVEDLLDAAFAQSQLSPSDRGLCQELVYGVTRWQSTLDWLINRKTGGRAQKTVLQILLRLGLYQIFWLDRIPDHAAVHETVEQARRSGFGPQSGFINAVLRGYLREADATRQALADLRVSKPHLGYSHPEWLTRRWSDRWGPDRTAELMEWNNTPPKTFARVNTLKTDPGALLERWREEAVDYDFVQADWIDENLMFELKSHPPLHDLASFRNGWFYIQDPSTTLAVRELDPRPGQSVLDLCAAPGGKTTLIAQRMENKGNLLATDLTPDRLSRLQENCRRLGVTNVRIEAVNADGSGMERLGMFDRVLVDAPCSNTGVMRRRVDLRWRVRPEEVERLRTAQNALLRSAGARLKPGGTLIYSTCSLEPEENRDVVAQFLREHPAFRLESERELLPFKDRTDGAFVARLTH